MNIRDLMRRSAQMNAARPAVRHRDRTLSYAEAWSRGVRLANGLAELGLGVGDRVAVLEDNTLEAADFFLGTTAGGFVRVPLYARNSLEAHVKMATNADCVALVVSDTYRAEGEAIADAVGMKFLLVRDDGYERWLAGRPDDDPDPELAEQDVYLIRHTGGTTGTPRGAVYTHRTWINGLRDWFYAYPVVAPGDVFMHVGPISHGSGYFFTPIWLSGGVNLLLDHFDPDETIDLMEREQVAYAFVVPTMAAALSRVDGAADRNWSRLKMFHISGAPVTDETALACRRLFGDVLYQMYGQTEAVTATIMSSEVWFSDVPGSNPLRSAGRPFPFAEVEIVDDQGAIAGPGVEGEIVIRCDGQMTEYVNDPKGTAEKIRDGWVHTGDIGKFDDNGFLYVLDRLDDMIVSGGFNLWPSEIENVIADHPAIREVAVFAIPDERWGETPLAHCVVEPTSTVTTEEIVELCRERLGSYKKPSRVVFTEEPLPKSPTGKVQRRVLREPYWSGNDRRVGGS